MLGRPCNLRIYRTCITAIIVTWNLLATTLPCTSLHPRACDERYVLGPWKDGSPASVQPQVAVKLHSSTAYTARGGRLQLCGARGSIR